MRTIADLINEWIEAKPNRSAAALARATGVPKSTISSILKGRQPSLEVSIKLVMAFPKEMAWTALSLLSPELKQLIESRE